jgi:uncharacterized protein DUF1707
MAPGGHLDDGLRVGDAERERAADELAGHAVAGRLTGEELEQRVGLAWAARTRGDLARLLDDLPAREQTRSTLPRVMPALPVLALILSLAVLTFALGHPAPALWLVAIVLWRRSGFRGRSVSARRII